MLGYFSFTEVTDPTAHAAYNEWHQLDHLPEQFSIEGIRFGQRWVCSPRCAEARLAVSPLLARCHYMTLYLLRDAGILPEFFELAQHLRQSGRFFEARQAHLSGPFDVIGQWAAGRTPVSAAAVPFRPAHGVYVVVGGASAELTASLQDVHLEWPACGNSRNGHRRRTRRARPGDTSPWPSWTGTCGRCRRSWPAPLGAQPGLEWAGPLERVDPFHWGWFG